MSLTQVVLEEFEKARRGEESKFKRRFRYNPSVLVWELDEKANPAPLRRVGWRLELIDVCGGVFGSEAVTLHLISLPPLQRVNLHFGCNLRIVEDSTVDRLVLGCSHQLARFYSERLETAFEEFKL